MAILYICGQLLGAGQIVLERDKHYIPLSLQDDVDQTVPASVLNELWEQLLIKHGVCWAKVISDSMYPMIKKGYQVLVEKYSSERIRLGDIVTFKRNGHLIVHRVLKKYAIAGEGYFLEKGDATLVASRIPAGDIIGRVCAIKNSAKVVQITFGRGRILQLILALISYGSLRLWVVLEYSLTFGRRRTVYPHYASVYKRLFSLVRKAIVLPIERNLDRGSTG
jgi:signal peptidase I